MGKKSLILLVDDEDFNLHILQEMLNLEGYETLQALSAEEAFAVLEKEDVDLILSDIYMPGQTGIDLCKRIKQNVALQSIPVILVTGKQDEDILAQSYEAGAIDFVRKPYSFLELKFRIRSALHLRRSQEILQDKNQQLRNAYQKLDDELLKLRKLQLSLLPHHYPVFPGYSFHAEYFPCGRASGDYYDYIEIDDKCLGVVIADVSGHGAHASVIMALLRTFFRLTSVPLISPTKTLFALNQFLAQNIYSGDFVTMFYGVIDTEAQTFCYANAGHNYPFIWNAQKQQLEEVLSQNALPLAIREEFEINETVRELNKGDRLLLFTDGLTDGQNPDGVFIGKEHIMEIVGRAARQADTIENFVKDISRDFFNFTQSAQLFDDVTISAIEIIDFSKPHFVK